MYKNNNVFLEKSNKNVFIDLDLLKMRNESAIIQLVKTFLLRKGVFAGDSSTFYFIICAKAHKNGGIYETIQKGTQFITGTLYDSRYVDRLRQQGGQ